jgi:riboflavin kinase/FMN adenylyltransferase
MERVREVARSRKARPGVLTFHPHPRQVLFGASIPLISPLAERIEFLSSAGAERIWVVNFTRRFSHLSAEHFLERWFCSLSTTRGIVVGEDFTFGRGGKHNRRLLRSFAREKGIHLEIFPWVREDGRKVSSQRIRRLIARGDVERASQLLGRPFSVTGPVVSGKGRGRSLGFPTVNLEVPPEIVHPRYGVYFVRYSGPGLSVPAIANLGLRPTFETGSAPTLEVFVPGRRLQIRAGTAVTVHFLKFIRNERRFRSSAALVRQIHRDLAIFSDFVHTHHWERYGEPAS